MVKRVPPYNIAHRGGAGLFPENTLAAFDSALDIGVAGFELDVQISRDGSVVVFHDDALKPEIVRDATGNWLPSAGALIQDLTHVELQSFDIGRLKPGTDYAAHYPVQSPIDGERIPKLSDVIYLIKRSGGQERLWIELKTNFLDRSRTASPRAMAEAVMQTVRREGFLERVVLVGFDWNALLEAKRIEPDVECWFTSLPQSWFLQDPPPTRDGPPAARELERLRSLDRGNAPWTGGFDRSAHGNVIKAVKAAGADGWFPYHSDLTAESVGEARALGLKIGAWTVNDPTDIQRLIRLGIDGICSDYPDRVNAELGQM